MPALVPLQEPFSYSLWPIVTCMIMIILLFVYLVIPVIMKKIKQKKEQHQKPIKVEEIKKKYCQQLVQLKDEVNANKISTRKAYQKLSMTIRQFVYELTGINVQNCTLTDIEKMNMPILTELVQEYYKPEFSEDSQGDIKKSIEKTRMVIEKWS